MAVNIPNVRETRPGYFVYRTKINGRVVNKAIGRPDAPDFAERLQKAKTYFQQVRRRAKAEGQTRPTKGRHEKGTMGALIVDYRRSPGYTDLMPSTRRDYARHLDLIDAEWGTSHVADLRASVIEKRRDKFLPQRGTANAWLKIMRNLLDLAVRLDYIDFNVSRPIKLLKTGEHEPWPDAVIDEALASANNDITVLAILTALYSGQRISDCIRITHKMMAGPTIELKQFKRRSKGTRVVEVYIPVHPSWRKAVESVEPLAETILYDRMGRPFKETGLLQDRMRDLMKRLGHVDSKGKAAYTFHGLRKNAANHLAEQGLSDQQIGAICGMDLDTVRHYTKRARKRVLAESARAAMDGSDIRKR